MGFLREQQRVLASDAHGSHGPAGRPAHDSPRRTGLAIQRRDGESVELDLPSGEIVLVKVYNAQAGRCHLLIAAPDDVHIRRTELARRIA